MDWKTNKDIGRIADATEKLVDVLTKPKITITPDHNYPSVALWVTKLCDIRRILKPNVSESLLNLLDEVIDDMQEYRRG